MLAAATNDVTEECVSGSTMDTGWTFESLCSVTSDFQSDFSSSNLSSLSSTLCGERSPRSNDNIGRFANADLLDRSVDELRAEIVDLRQQVAESDRRLVSSSVELASLSKSERWYREQLHESRRQRTELLAEIGQLRAALSCAERDLRVIGLERSDCSYEKSPSRGPSRREIYTSCSTEPELLDNEDEDLKADLESTAENLRNCNVLYESTRLQNAKLIAEVTKLKKTYNLLEISCKMGEAIRTELQFRIDDLLTELSHCRKSVNCAVEERAAIKTALHEALREKTEIEHSVLAIRTEFFKFKQNYTNLCQKNHHFEKDNNQLRVENKILHESIAYGTWALAKFESDLDRLELANARLRKENYRQAPNNSLFVETAHPSTDASRAELRRLRVLSRANELKSTETARRYELSNRTLLQNFAEFKRSLAKTNERHDRELTRALSEHHFLQRLCKDLKFSLTVKASREQVLEKRLKITNSSIEMYNSMLNFIRKIPSPMPFDESDVRKLIQRSKGIEIDPVDCIEKSIDLLKLEVANVLNC